MNSENDLQWNIMCSNIRRLRLQSGVTIQELAAATDIPADLLEDLEKYAKREDFYLDHLFALCVYFKQHPKYFFV